MVKIVSLIIFFIFIFLSCNRDKKISSIDPVNWQKRAVTIPAGDSLISGETYLSVYSEIYSETEHKTHPLTATVSMRNTSAADTIFITKAQYFDTHGKAIRSYFENPIFLAPMETVEIVIDEGDFEGGTGANFLFDWKISPETSEPLFEAVMISTSGQQGLSFTSKGKRVK